MHIEVSIVLIICILLLIYSASKNFINAEYYNGSLYPLHIPPNRVGMEQGNGFVDYSQVDKHKLCPTPIGAGKHCNSHNDCPGVAEVCWNSTGYPVIDGMANPDPEANYCTCSIVNPCLEPGIC